MSEDHSFIVHTAADTAAGVCVTGLTEASSKQGVVGGKCQVPFLARRLPIKIHVK